MTMFANHFPLSRNSPLNKVFVGVDTRVRRHPYWHRFGQCSLQYLQLAWPPRTNRFTSPTKASKIAGSRHKSPNKWSHKYPLSTRITENKQYETIGIAHAHAPAHTPALTSPNTALTYRAVPHRIKFDLKIKLRKTVPKKR